MNLILVYSESTKPGGNHVDSLLIEGNGSFSPHFGCGCFGVQPKVSDEVFVCMHV